MNTDFKPILQFMVCSDTHINGADDEKCERIKNTINLAYSLAEEQTLDAVVFVGDLTDRGHKYQFDAFENAVKSVLKDNTKILAVVARNHDSWDEGKLSLKYCKGITGENPDFHVVLNGFHFIGLSTSKNKLSRYDLSQRSWIKQQLQSAYEDDKNKPIFMCYHEHVRNTVYGSSDFDGWGIPHFKGILKKYPNLVHFSGHSHYPANDPRSIWKKDYTCIGTGAMSYMELTVDFDRKVHPEDHEKAAQAWLVQVDENNIIRLRCIEAFENVVLCERYIDITKPYTYSKSSAPAFDENAELTVEESDGKFKVVSPSASSTDGEPVFLYRITVKDKNGNVTHSEYKVNNYWLRSQFETIEFQVGATEGSLIEVVAENCFGEKSNLLKKGV